MRAESAEWRPASAQAGHPALLSSLSDRRATCVQHYFTAKDYIGDDAPRDVT